MALPIFVLGRNRSGTKWLSNIIANHKDIAAVQHPDHFGILEASDILFHMPIIFGDLNIPENYIGFLECFSQTDFFKITNIDKSYFYEFRQPDYFSFFRTMMDKYAEQQQKRYWIQKSDIVLNDLYHEFDDAKYIIILREMVDNIRSTVALNNHTSDGHYKTNLLKLQLKYFTDMSQVEKVWDNNNVHIIHFEDQVRDKKTTIIQLCDFLEIDFNESMLEDHFKKNTSYGNTLDKKMSINKEEILNSTELFKMKINSALLAQLPNWVYDRLHLHYKKKFLEQVQSDHSKKFLSFKLKKQELGW